MPTSSFQLVCVGDSLTAGLTIGANAPFSPFADTTVALLQRELGVTCPAPLLLATCGITACDAVANARRVLLLDEPWMPPSTDAETERPKPDMLTILVGTNDVGRRGVEGVEDAICAIVALLQRVLARLRNTITVLITLPALGMMAGGNAEEHHFCRVVLNTLLVAIAAASVLTPVGGEAAQRAPLVLVDLWRATAKPRPDCAGAYARGDVAQALIRRLWTEYVAEPLQLGHFDLESSKAFEAVKSAVPLDLCPEFDADSLHLTPLGYELLGQLVAEVVLPRRV